ncbi:putative diguanylate cyclase AdrA [mine drainage metagenome]|uniref:Putative diguanylate cyclase AdrA n=1 Tax=mine drainage metagenome TaxID=410659 RepID=A0A1J5Q1T3_9ZZZZ
MPSFITNLMNLRSVLARWQADHDGIADAATTVNLKHLRWIAPVGAVINALHVLVLGTQYFSGAYQGVTLAWRTGLLIAHFIMGLTMIVFTIAVRQVDPTRPKYWDRQLPVGAVAVCLLFAVAIVTIDQLVTVNITPFLVGCLAMGVLFYVKPLQSGVLYLTATVGYFLCIGLTQNNLEQLLSNRLNGITIGILGWVLQFVMWRNFTTITCQQHLLAQTNAKLTDRQAELERLVRDDVLTGLPNRLAANERLHTEFVSMKRSNEGYAVLMMDIDFFKRVNDTHGHAVGDQVLQSVAKTIQVTLRESDFAARFGGEEFLALLPFTDLPAALRVAEKLRQAVESSADPVTGRITLSIGLSLATPDQASKDVAVREADDALYCAKRGGRNRVQVASESLEQAEPGDTATAKLLQLVWHATYESGDQTIDTQHRALFRHANKLLQAALDGCPQQELVALVKAFIAEVAQHFRDEEAIIIQAGYPGAVDHASLHRALIEKATDLTQRVSAGNLGVSELFMYLVHDMVKRHMLTADRKFFPYLQTGH